MHFQGVGCARIFASAQMVRKIISGSTLRLLSRGIIRTKSSLQCSGSPRCFSDILGEFNFADKIW